MHVWQACVCIQFTCAWVICVILYVWVPVYVHMYGLNVHIYVYSLRVHVRCLS